MCVCVLHKHNITNELQHATCVWNGNIYKITTDCTFFKWWNRWVEIRYNFTFISTIKRVKISQAQNNELFYHIVQLSHTHRQVLSLSLSTSFCRILLIVRRVPMKTDTKTFIHLVNLYFLNRMTIVSECHFVNSPNYCR